MKQKIIATNDTIKEIVNQEIAKYGFNVDLNHIDTSQVTDFSYLFSISESNGDFNGDISQWNTSNAKTMSYMFYFSSFNGDISQWDVSHVQNMSYMFCYSEFTGNISNWNVGNLICAHGMFFNARFNGDISRWDMSNVTDIGAMFSKSYFNQDISHWKIKSIKNISYFLENCNDFEQFQVFNSFFKQIDKKIDNKIKDFDFFFQFREDFKLNLNKIKKLIQFINQENIIEYFNVYHLRPINHVKTCYPLLSCECFFKFNTLPKEQKLINFLLFFNCEKNSEKAINELNNYNDINNLDVLFYFLNHINHQNKNSKPSEQEQFSYLKQIEGFLLRVFNKDAFKKMFNGMNELFTLFEQLLSDEEIKNSEEFQFLKNFNSDDPISSFPFIQMTIDSFFKLEKDLIQSKNKIYFNYLKENNSSYSDFYPYYSLIQKKDLIFLKKEQEHLVNLNQDIFI